MLSPNPLKSDFQRLTVGDVMETREQSAHARTKADVLASMMIDGFGAMPIVDESRHLIGIVSEQDLLAVLERGHKLSEMPAESVMTRNPYSVRAETDMATLIHVLLASDLIRAPVVDAEEKLIGVVARRDILRAYLSAQGGTSTLRDRR